MAEYAGGFAVLDIETMPCQDAMAITVRGACDPKRPALHQLCSAAVLTGTETSDGFKDVEVAVFTRQRLSEVEMLGCLDVVLPDPADSSSKLIVYNGLVHDLRVLRLRLAANWMFSARVLSGWCIPERGRVLDMMVEGFGGRGKYWNLPDLCAGLGFAIRPGLLRRPVSEMVAKGRWDIVAEHNLMDVVGTYLAYASWRSLVTGSDRPVATAWVCVAEALSELASAEDTFGCVNRHHLLGTARARLVGTAKQG